MLDARRRSPVLTQGAVPPQLDDLEIAGVSEAYRVVKRRFRVNRMTLPFLTTIPENGVTFRRGEYFRYLARRRPSPAPILAIELPYFKFEAHRALNF